MSATLSALSIIFNKFSSQPSLSELVWCRYALWHMELADLCPRGPRRTRRLGQHHHAAEWHNEVHPKVMWAKFDATAEGAGIASQLLWR